MASYRLVYFTRNPFLGDLQPIGALVGVSGKSVSFVHSERLLLESTVEERQRMLVADATDTMASASIAHELYFNFLPDSLGPHFTLGEMRAMPHDVEDPEGWVLSCLLQ